MHAMTNLTHITHHHLHGNRQEKFRPSGQNEEERETLPRQQQYIGGIIIIIILMYLHSVGGCVRVAGLDWPGVGVIGSRV